MTIFGTSFVEKLQVANCLDSISLSCDCEMKWKMKQNVLSIAKPYVVAINQMERIFFFYFMLCDSLNEVENGTDCTNVHLI